MVSLRCDKGKPTVLLTPDKSSHKDLKLSSEMATFPLNLVWCVILISLKTSQE